MTLSNKAYTTILTTPLKVPCLSLSILFYKQSSLKPNQPTRGLLFSGTIETGKAGKIQIITKQSRSWKRETTGNIQYLGVQPRGPVRPTWAIFKGCKSNLASNTSLLSRNKAWPSPHHQKENQNSALTSKITLKRTLSEEEQHPKSPPVRREVRRAIC